MIIMIIVIILIIVSMLFFFIVWFVIIFKIVIIRDNYCFIKDIKVLNIIMYLKYCGELLKLL